MKLEVGQFVRTKDGIIAKVDCIDDTTIFFDKDLYKTYSDSIDFLERDNLERIVKASYNIIDILEEEDYANGNTVFALIDDQIPKLVATESGCLCNEEIKSVITHEQIEQMTYKVG